LTDKNEVVINHFVLFCKRYLKEIRIIKALVRRAPMMPE